MNDNVVNVAILGASGYTGAETIRLLLQSNKYHISAMSADSKAGLNIGQVFSHMRNHNLPSLLKVDDINFNSIDAVISCMPHGKSQEIISSIPNNIKISDLSADFRFSDINLYEKTYEVSHKAASLQKEVVYGLTELNRVEIKKCRIVSNPGCYPTSALIPLIPLVKNNLIEIENIIVDSKSGVSGAGRNLKESLLFAELSEGFGAYSLANHRHAPEINFQLSEHVESNVNITFTPHLLPIKRGILSTIYFKIKNDYKLKDIKNCLSKTYKNEQFIDINEDYIPSTHDVRGTNLCSIGLAYDNNTKNCIVVSVIDNLIKGASGQALQNLNVMFGNNESEGLINIPMFI